ncbi:MAG: 6-carboxytetrahydropterin synthase [Microscillaceae bacterium]|nr:6-carboxytetrahydropterin synthase [Microscillaceae bacterium]
MVYICRKEHFNAAHRLFNPQWSEAKNQEIFGICANPNFHGHNFELVVTVKGRPNPDTGMVMDMKKLGDLIKSAIVDKLDHKNLNLDVDFLEGKIPSCETLIVEIWNILEAPIRQLGPGQLHRIQLFETPKNFVEYYGEV